MKVLFSGGLGNQMFQYAFLLLLRKIGYSVTGDTSIYYRNNAHYGFELKNVFSLSERFTSSKITAYGISFLEKINSSLIFREGRRKIDLKSIPKSTRFLWGYWQNSKYVNLVEEELNKAFKFRNIDTENENIASEISKTTSVSIHLRRGDYLGHPLYKDICTKDYYAKAIDFFDKNESTFYIFSNDEDFAREFTREIGIPAKIIAKNTGAASYNDMYLMSSCHHNIIANSSFSWWSAWLNKNPKKIIISPKKWMNAPTENFEKIIPDNWKKI